MFTTSRYASKETRAVARRIAEDKGERFFARGKKTIAQLVLVTRRLGEKNIFIVEECKKKPGAVALIEVSETGGWKWANNDKT
ncbi:MAG: hypothetical protein QXD77_03190 [Candidatus Aenigmatarchaeota archaeon]